jgi:DNA replication protein DnaC
VKKVFHQFRGMTLDDYHPHHETQEAAKEIVGKYLGDLKGNRRAAKGLAFTGPAGVGKTMLASIVLNKAYDDDYRIESATVSGYIDLLLRLGRLETLIKHEEYDDDTATELIRADHHVREIQGLSKRSADWVLFDDLGREHESQSGWTQVRIHDAVRYRYDRGYPTLITSNLVIGDVARRYGEPLLSFLNEVTTIVPMEGHDYRRPWSEDS